MVFFGGLIAGCVSDDVIRQMGDGNAHGAVKISAVLGYFRVAEIVEDVELLLELSAKNKAAVCSSTFFKKREIHKGT